jgi:hypothetical protein
VKDVLGVALTEPFHCRRDRKNPNIRWTRDRGNGPTLPRDQFPWFWDGDTVKGERVNDVHLTNRQRQDPAARSTVFQHVAGTGE